MLAPILSMIIAVAQPVAPPSAAPSVSLRVTGEGAVCRIVANGHAFRIPGDAARLEAFLRSFATPGAIADIAHVDENVAYTCIGHAILLTQRAGLAFTRIGFLSEPDAGTNP
ncbi:MAG TPA: hypothetical protein VFR28_02430 [Allosphingosinicella sp.]|nr:hypothetical protein [Allosphingosinicella sp.]